MNADVTTAGERPADSRGRGRSNQHGAALILSLVLLLVMTILAVASLRTTTLEERMAGNARDRQVAFEAAEAALIDAERYIDDSVLTLAGFDDDGSDGLYDEAVDLDGDGTVDGTDERIWEHVDWSGDDDNTNESLAYTDYEGEAVNAPRYVIRHYGTVTAAADELNIGNYGEGTGAGATDLFRITVRATGGADGAVVILQGTYGKRI